MKDLGDHTYQITEAGLNELDVKEEEVCDGWQEFIDPSDKHIAIGSVKSLVNLIEKEIEIIVSSGSEGQINEAEVLLRYIELSFRTLMQATSLKKRNLDWDSRRGGKRQLDMDRRLTQQLSMSCLSKVRNQRDEL